MAKKKNKKAVNKKPKWVGEVDLSGCEPGLVYNIYQCRKCILEYKFDQARSKRRRMILEPGTKKKKSIEVCNCVSTPLLIKYKKCPCGAEYWGFYLRERGTCQICGAYVEKIHIKVRDYYRMKQFFKTSEIDLHDEERWDCIHRNFCLEATFVDGSKRGIACDNCPYYDNGGGLK